MSVGGMDVFPDAGEEDPPALLYGAARESAAVSDEPVRLSDNEDVAEGLPSADVYTEEELQEIYATTATVMESFATDLDLPADINAPTDDMDLGKLYQLLRAAVNQSFRVQRTLAVQIGALSLVAHGLPAEIVEDVAGDVQNTLQETLLTLTKGLTLREQLLYYNSLGSRRVEVPDDRMPG